MNKEDVIGALREAVKSGDLIQRLKAVRKEPGAKPLSRGAIKALERDGNQAEDWGLIKVLPGFDPGRIKNSSFTGRIVLGRFDNSVKLEDKISLPSGIYRSHLVDCVVGGNALISDTRLLSNYRIGEGAVVFNCGEVFSGKKPRFGCGESLPVAIEVGGREVKTYAEMTIEVAALVASSRRDRKLLENYEKLLEEYLTKIDSDKGVICPGAVIKNTPRIVDVFLGPGGTIDNALAVRNTTVLSNTEEVTRIADGVLVENSIVQWGSEVTSQAIVASSVLTEHSHVERHGKVTNSILGPNTGVAEGEVTACLLGPFVGFHHQALLIAAYWPEGKGNVAYGANIGSNHTGKAPDQEIWCGEGTFFGLGANVKYPANFSRAPYSIIASGVNTLPQKVTFPFSLINVPRKSYPGISPAYNEIMPGWVLSDNIFTIKRNEGKYRKRNRARRSKFDLEVFRPEIVDLILAARKRLQVRKTKEVYTEKDIEGLGKNFLTEANRKRGMETYSFYLTYYCLCGLKRKAEETLASGSRHELERLLVERSRDPRWEHERKILLAELEGNGVKDNLELLSVILEKIARSVEDSKAKDDQRGVRIIDDYPYSHTLAADDEFVRETWTETKKSIKEIRAILKSLG